jgi:hypothetical protein
MLDHLQAGSAFTAVGQQPANNIDHQVLTDVEMTAGLTPEQQAVLLEILRTFCRNLAG